MCQVLLDLVYGHDRDFLELFVIMAWAIWHARNDVAFNSGMFDVLQIISKSSRSYWIWHCGQGSSWTCSISESSNDPAQAEISAIRYAVSLAIDAGFKSLEVESDAKTTIDALRGGAQFPHIMPTLL
ncbi:hypothetical protein GH714_002712 [Hevea brasiliensis]|uniref:RNase H type-1 domain-containing protein n=1 Tax=Hevea brasiliensis TaxID=3981 RepID=A0A6A6LMS5_HEVBR|nr:hypothetical protein GH714_002712 [Hevea brasiliensis]